MRIAGSMRCAALGAVLALASACADMPAAGTAEREAWIRQKQDTAVANQEAGRVGDSLRWFPLPSSMP